MDPVFLRGSETSYLLSVDHVHPGVPEPLIRSSGTQPFPYRSVGVLSTTVDSPSH